MGVLKMDDEAYAKVYMSKSKWFKFSDFVDSEKAKELGIDNKPDDRAIKNIVTLMAFLDRMRDAWGGPIIVNSGFRCEELNKAVGGKSTSGHLSGYAADIRMPASGVKIDVFFDWLMRWLGSEKITYDECFLERGKKSIWVHFALYSINEEQRMKNGVLKA